MSTIERYERYLEELKRSQKEIKKILSELINNEEQTEKDREFENLLFSHISYSNTGIDIVEIAIRNFKK